MNRPKADPLLIAAIIGGALYPLLAWRGLAVLPPSLLACAGLALIGLRVLALRGHPRAGVWRFAFLVAAAAMLATLCFDAHLAALAYPVLVSLAVAAVFAYSIVNPPSIVETIARLREPDLPQAGVIYTRRVTVIWIAFLVANAAIAASLALWGSMAQWALWTGCLSYVCMGALFAGELAVRRAVRR